MIANKALLRAAIPLRSIASGQSGEADREGHRP